MEMPVEKVIQVVNSLDLKVLSLENVELLQRMVPTEQEVYFHFIFLRNNFVTKLFALLSDKGIPRVHNRKEKREPLNRGGQVPNATGKGRENIDKIVDHELHRQLLRQSAPHNAPNPRCDIRLELGQKFEETARRFGNYSRVR